MQARLSILKENDMDRNKVRLMQVDLGKMFADFEKKFDVKVSMGGARYGESNATFKIEASDKAADGTVLNKTVEAFKHDAKYYGLDADDFGKTFVFRRETFKISGLKPRSTRFPILATRTDGKTFKFPAGDVCRYLGKKTPINDVIGAGDIGTMEEID
jgi:hypothetical protein